MTTQEITPNASSAASDTSVVPSLDNIAAKMTAMRNQAAERLASTTQGSQPESRDTSLQVDTESDPSTDLTTDTLTPEHQVSDSDSDSDSTATELIDFIEFAETHPEARFRFMRNGREVVIDARKAAAILGQGSAIHDEARELKIKRSEFEEYERETRNRQDQLLLAMEFTVEPRLRTAYDEIVKTQGYQATFQQQMAATRDPAQQARIQASMQQNERYIQQQQAVIARLRPQVDHFRSARQQQVSALLEQNRRNFQDRELRNQFVFNEVREKVARNWSDAEGELIPGIKNIDLISSDEHILSLVRDGLRYRDRPGAKSAGASVAQVQRRRGTTPARNNGDQEIAQLRQRANNGDRKAADNLLVAQLNRIRAARGQRT